MTAIAGAVSLAPELGTAPDGSEAAGVVVFVGVLPLLNGLADFGSVGLTRFLLRRGLARGLGWSSGLDVLGALAVFALLGMSVIAFVHFVRPQDGAAMLDLAAAFAAIRADPGAYWWLGFMLFSTLIPTVLHLAVFLAALWSWWPFALRRWVARMLHLGAGEDGSALKGQTGALMLAFMLTLSVFVPVFAILEGARHAPGLVDLVIDGFEGFASLIGAV